MKVGMPLILAASIVAAPACAEQATPQEATRAEGEMITRVSAAVERYAESINIDRAYVGYCRVKLNLIGDGHPIDGSVPFGINYLHIDRDVLKIQINAREVFERSYMILCLSEARNTLRAAATR
jgi:hypothetical protein